MAAIDPEPPGGATGPVGFGGWLILLVIGQVIGLIRGIVSLVSDTDGYAQVLQVPGGRGVVYGELALLLGFLVFQLFVTIQMFRKKRSFKMLFLYQWILVLVVATADTLLVAIGLQVPFSTFVTVSQFGTWAGAFLIGGFWVLYVFNSIRVRNTFVA